MAAKTEPTNEHVAALIKADWKKDDAEAKVKQLTETLEKKHPKETPEFIDAVLKTLIAKLTKSNIEPVQGVCVGFSRKQDSNNFAKRKAAEVYAQDPTQAVNEKFVVVDSEGKIVYETHKDGSLVKDKEGNAVPVWADNREYVDEAHKMKNSRYGKALGENIQRTGFFIVDGKFFKVFGNFDVQMGYEYTLYGTKSPKGYISIPKTGPGVKRGKMLDEKKYWEIVAAAAADDELAVNLGGTVDIAKNKFVVTQGTVTASRETGQNHMVVITDDSYPDGMICFTDDEAAAKEAESLGPGNEIILVGRIGESADKLNGGVRRNISLMGWATNPESDKIAGATRDMDEVLYS